MPQSAHIDENQLLQLIEGELAPGEVEALEDHVDTCAACGDLMIRVARELAPDAGADAASDSNDRYRIDGELGAGGMGVVYRAFDETLHREVALKLVRPDLLERKADTDPTGRLLKEARALAALSHPNVVTVFDAGEVNGRVFVATELVQGRNVTEWVADEAPDMDKVVAVFAQAGRGLAAAHDAGIVHRDIKPDNILVGDDGRVRVADFGLATSGGRETVRHIAGLSSADIASTDVDARATTLAHTITGVVVGTPVYMAPEQLAGQPPDPRSDQFSFCVSLYESRYRKRPFAGRSLLEIADNVAAGDVRPVEVGTSRAAAVHRVILRGLSPDPARRFGSMHDLVAALEEAVAGEDVATRRPRLGLWVGAITAVAAGAVALYVATRPGDGKPAAGAGSPPDASTKSSIAAATPSLDAAPSPPTVAAAPADAAPSPDAARVVRAATRRPRPPRRISKPAVRAKAPTPDAAAIPTFPLTAKQQSGKLYVEAAQRTNARDGRGCLAKFAKADALGHPPPYDETLVRARCRMLAGKCDAGKKLHAAFLRKKGLGQVAIDTEVAREAKFFCPANQGPWSVRLARISYQTSISRANKGIAVRLSRALHAVVRDAGGGMSPAQHIAVYNAARTLADALSRFGDCKGARGIWHLGMAAYPARGSAAAPHTAALTACLSAAAP